MTTQAKTGIEMTAYEAVSPKPGSESMLTVLVALAANSAIALLKLLAGLITGSAAMLAEAAHSLADTTTEVFLLTALKRSQHPADRQHPFGYGKESYFWSFMAAIGIFAFGAMFAFYEGFRTVFGEREEQVAPLVGYVVLGLAFAMEATSWLRAITQIRREAARVHRRFFAHIRQPGDPTVRTVLLEDTAALIGLLLAFVGIGLHQLTGSSLYDGLASIAIGVLLLVVAFQLAANSKNLLIGRQAELGTLRQIRAQLAAQPEVVAVVDMLSMMTGIDKILLCVRLDFRDTLSAADVEQATIRIHGELHARFEELDEVFLEPVPRANPVLRQRVLARYGPVFEHPMQIENSRNKTT